ncbi:hypothetical protein NE236_08720 [Actinoallomurus purpureus]|uniref:CoA-transferase n=1 Tax=Actinoallomurus purpureus TaxID=478114 RepID=UPI0020924DEB|nr:CoA-transferase [Actinoallomurus purpureus]MCO6005064.1 hypothetical protein [Actinoallomurus purpureus]
MDKVLPTAAEAVTDVGDGASIAVKDGSPKIVEECSLPLTGAACVHRVITDLGVLDVTPEGPVLVETAPGVSEREIRDRTGPPIGAPR